ncbi:hypothetical protein KQI63_09810 [bacterium]|nr:hypothetical protein [bacterium]
MTFRGQLEGYVRSGVDALQEAVEASGVRPLARTLGIDPHTVRGCLAGQFSPATLRDAMTQAGVGTDYERFMGDLRARVLQDPHSFVAAGIRPAAVGRFIADSYSIQWNTLIRIVMTADGLREVARA